MSLPQGAPPESGLDGASACRHYLPLRTLCLSVPCAHRGVFNLIQKTCRRPPVARPASGFSPHCCADAQTCPSACLLPDLGGRGPAEPPLKMPWESGATGLHRVWVMLFSWVFWFVCLFCFFLFQQHREARATPGQMLLYTSRSRRTRGLVILRGPGGRGRPQALAWRTPRGLTGSGCGVTH